MKEPRCCQQVIATLSGVSQQAISQGGGPRCWLATHIRQALVPDLVGFVPNDVAATITDRATEMVRQASQKLQGLSSLKAATGRPAERSPEGLALHLGVPFKQGMRLQDVYTAFVNRFIVVLRPELKPGVPWTKVQKALDNEGSFPYYPHAKPAYCEEEEVTA